MRAELARIRLLRRSSAMDAPGFVRRRAFVVLGVITRLAAGTESPEKFAAIWSAFESRRSEIEPFRIGHRYYGVSFPVDGGVDYLAGLRVANDVIAPVGLEVRVIAAAEYAVFACPLGGIGPTYARIFGPWRAKVGAIIAEERPAFEEYRDDLESTDAVHIHIPLRHRPAPV